jgi:alkylhydroperoxidase family enzyme
VARLGYADPASGAAELSALVERIKRERGGRLLNLYRMLLHSPTVTEGYLGLGTAVRYRARLDGRSRELAICEVARLTGSAYEWRQHAPLARREGIDQAQLDALPDWADRADFDARDRAVLAYADRMTDQIQVDDATFEQVRAHFDDQEIVELTATIAFYNLVARFLIALRVDLEA